MAVAIPLEAWLCYQVLFPKSAIAGKKKSFDLNID
jgi:hypothetical protein